MNNGKERDPLHVEFLLRVLLLHFYYMFSNSSNSLLIFPFLLWFISPLHKILLHGIAFWISQVWIHIQLVQADCSILELYILVCMKRLEVKEQNSYNFNSVMKGQPKMFSSVLFFFLFFPFYFHYVNLPLLTCLWFIAEYKGIHDAYQTSDYYARNVCLRVCMNENYVSKIEFNIKMTHVCVPFQLIIPACNNKFWSQLLQAFEHLVQRELICFMDNRGNNQSIEFRAVKLLISSHELYQGLKSYRSCPVSSYKNSVWVCIFLC